MSLLHGLLFGKLLTSHASMGRTNHSCCHVFVGQASCKTLPYYNSIHLFIWQILSEIWSLDMHYWRHWRQGPRDSTFLSLKLEVMSYYLSALGTCLCSSCIKWQPYHSDLIEREQEKQALTSPVHRTLSALGKFPISPSIKGSSLFLFLSCKGSNYTTQKSSLCLPFHPSTFNYIGRKTSSSLQSKPKLL